MKLAGRFMLMRDPTAGTSPAQEERIAEDGAHIRTSCAGAGLQGLTKKRMSITHLP